MKKVLLGVFFIITFTSAIFLPQWNNKGEDQVSRVPEEIVPASPVVLSIPVINVEAHIQQVGLTHLGAMDVPSNITDVAWFKHGAIPGTLGSAVISGHFNGENNEAGVFARLNTLKNGDLIHVTIDTGEIRTFEVKDVRDYDATGRAAEVFAQNDLPRLNLITCEGDWNKKSESFTKRRVVFAILVR